MISSFHKYCSAIGMAVGRRLLLSRPLSIVSPFHNNTNLTVHKHNNSSQNWTKFSNGSASTNIMSRRPFHISSNCMKLDDVHVTIESTKRNTNTEQSTTPSSESGSSCSQGIPNIDNDDEEEEQEEMFVTSDPILGVGSIPEWGGPRRGGSLKEPTRFGDWERKGRCTDF